ncbi:hypothetical protein ACSFA0_04865 [Variovorax sp. LT1P1]|uniref:hypothetical protein n=1 Tax=Variovorax sp. LT1P1 TaxID=3443730 RepID=UPI003F452B91
MGVDAGGEVEAAAVFFMGSEGAGGSALRPVGLDDVAATEAAFDELFAAALGAGAGGAAFFTAAAGFLADGTLTFLAAAAGVEAFFDDAADLAAAVFETTGFKTGLAFAAGFFTVAGSFDELERAFTGSPPEGRSVLRPRDPDCQAPTDGGPPGLYP